MNKYLSLTLVLILVLLSVITGCSSSTVTQTVTDTITSTITNTTTSTITLTTQPPTTTQTTTTTTVQPTTTAVELADYGGRVYNLNCGEGTFCGCHVGWNDGGKEWFAGTSWEYYGNAQRLFDYTKRFMPGVAPGSLSDLEYLQVIAFILVEINKILPEDLFGESKICKQ